MKAVDLHIHTNHSDGLLSVEEIVDKVQALGLKGFAITDHDTFNGIGPALEAIRRRNLDVLFVAGCEFSTYFEEIGELHVLAYFNDNRYQELQPLVREFRESRVRRARKILECLVRVGIRIEPEELIGDSESPVGRLHIARKIVDLGYYETTDLVFEKLLRSGAPCYIPRREIRTKEVIRTIREHGGRAVLAHPTILYNIRNWNPVQELIEAGLDGVEFHHPKISHDLSVKMEETWRGKLILTGGSDFHGDTPKEEIGRYGIDLARAREYFGEFRLDG